MNLISLPSVPPESHLPTKSDYILYVDSVQINGNPHADPKKIKTAFSKHINQSRYFKKVLDFSELEKPSNEKYLIVRSKITPLESHKYNWWAAWPAVYPMPFYWPLQPKKGEVSVSMGCGVYTHTGDLVAEYDACESQPYSVTFYGFFNNGDAEANLGSCYKSVFENITGEITSDKRILALTQEASPKKTTDSLSPPSKIIKQAAIPAGNFGSYHALVIGIDTYPGLSHLKTAVNDARAVSGILKEKYGFEVTLLANPGRAEIIASLSHLRKTLSPQDNLLIYYAGHGWLDKQADEGYWLPADAKAGDESNWISNATITSAIRANEAKHVLIVSDSCYSGKLTRAIHLTRKTRGYIQRLSEKKARVVMASGGLEPVEDSGRQGHSVFAAAFIDMLEKNDAVMEGSEAFSQIRHSVMLNADQTPEYGDVRKAGHEGGDFLFVSQAKGQITE
ncbi:caspase family protein [Desulfoluna sp.]|uniref:caspase family protein n=1 Tax=Desulfoluna sp. TaxID=2045199 RepID=UPI002617AB7B|nr:caspase family protein [Desulfoluna sp.]